MTTRGTPADKQEWRKRARCGNDSVSELTRQDPFFLGRGGKANKTKSFCDGCQVKRSCLAYALFYKEEDGIWGGMTPDERKSMPQFLIDLMMLEASDLIDVTESHDIDQWLPIIFPEPRKPDESENTA
jgi:WhiB family transcriptional regulator, redox-sensing transcriptional regulator